MPGHAITTPAADHITGKARVDGWSSDRRAAFLTELAECGAVSQAVETVGMGPSGLYALRQRDAVFAAAWDAARLLTRERLRDTMIERAFNGEIHITRKEGDETVRRRRDYRLSLGVLDRLEAQKFSPLARLFAANFEAVVSLIETDATAPRWRRWLDGIAHDLPDFKVRDLFPLAEESAKNAPEFGIWEYDENVWHTNMPPPDGFAGEEYADFGDEEYERELSDAEAAIHCERLIAECDGQPPEPSKFERGREAWADYFGGGEGTEPPAPNHDDELCGIEAMDEADAALGPIEYKSMDGLPRGESDSRAFMPARALSSRQAAPRAYRLRSARSAPADRRTGTASRG